MTEFLWPSFSDATLCVSTNINMAEQSTSNSSPANARNTMIGSFPPDVEGMLLSVVKFYTKSCHWVTVWRMLYRLHSCVCDIFVEDQDFPSHEWQARCFQAHPDVLELRERLCPFTKVTNNGLFFNHQWVHMLTLGFFRHLPILHWKTRMQRL